MFLHFVESLPAFMKNNINNHIEGIIYLLLLAAW